MCRWKENCNRGGNDVLLLPRYILYIPLISCLDIYFDLLEVKFCRYTINRIHAVIVSTLTFTTHDFYQVALLDSRNEFKTRFSIPGITVTFTLVFVNLQGWLCLTFFTTHSLHTYCPPQFRYCLQKCNMNCLLF